eukprot:COSAG04_NODE_550_length_12709_cov_6.177637_2_plen_88_part_00
MKKKKAAPRLQGREPLDAADAQPAESFAVYWEKPPVALMDAAAERRCLNLAGVDEWRSLITVRQDRSMNKILWVIKHCLDERDGLLS